MIKDDHGYDCDVCAIGTLAHITHVRVHSLNFVGYGCQSIGTSQIIGNDGVLVAKDISAKGYRVYLSVISPSVGDRSAIDLVRGAGVQVVTSDEHEGVKTEHICLEDDERRRYWIFGNESTSTVIPQLHKAALVYLDYYDELEHPIRALLNGECFRQSMDVLFVNLSSSRILEKAAFLRVVQPEIVQISLRDSLPPINLVPDFLKEVHELSGAQWVLGTMGHHGVIVHTGSSWFRAEGAKAAQGAPIGAGARLSSLIIERILEGQNFETATRAAVTAISAEFKDLRSD